MIIVSPFSLAESGATCERPADKESVSISQRKLGALAHRMILEENLISAEKSAELGKRAREKEFISLDWEIE